jgi:hypothetical protein
MSNGTGSAVAPSGAPDKRPARSVRRRRPLATRRSALTANGQQRRRNGRVGLDDGKQSGKLRDFSAQLAARLQAAPGPSGRTGAPGHPHRRFVLFAGHEQRRRNRQRAAGDLGTVDQALVPGAGQRARAAGRRDRPDAAGRRQPIAAEDAQQLVVFNENLKTNVGLLITRAFGLRNIKDLESLGPVHDRTRPWEARAFRDADGSRLVEIDLQGLMSFEEFTSIGV